MKVHGLDNWTASQVSLLFSSPSPSLLQGTHTQAHVHARTSTRLVPGKVPWKMLVRCRPWGSSLLPHGYRYAPCRPPPTTHHTPHTGRIADSRGGGVSVWVQQCINGRERWGHLRGVCFAGVAAPRRVLPLRLCQRTDTHRHRHRHRHRHDKDGGERISSHARCTSGHVNVTGGQAGAAAPRAEVLRV